MLKFLGNVARKRIIRTEVLLTIFTKIFDTMKVSTPAEVQISFLF